MSSDFERDSSLEQAQHRSSQTMHAFRDIVVHELDGETRLSIEINGVPITTLDCFDSALAELAAGWAFVHGFCHNPQDLDSASVSGNRASVMVTGGVDIDRFRDILSGAVESIYRVPDPFPRHGQWSIHDDVVLDILREAWSIFRNDRLAEGSVHAALASDKGIEVVAFDNSATNAFAKVLGWGLREQKFPTHEIAIVNGIVTRQMIDAASRLGVLVVATPFVPTADAYRAARIAGMSIVGYMNQQTVGIFHDAGLIQFENSET